MNKIILILGFSCLALSTVVFESDLNQFVTSFNPPQPVVQNTYPYNVTISQAPTAVWIWASNWNNAQTPSPITITQDFFANCGGQMTVYATADDNFTVSINDIEVLNGSNWRQVYSADFKPKCGKNKFSITAYNLGVGGASNPAGVIYAVVQDSSCYACPIGQAYNPKTCSCQCAAKHCACEMPHIWFDYPSCGCGCVKISQCRENYYFDQNSCSCKCVPRDCRQGFAFDDKTCQCVKKCVVKFCKRGQVWNNDICDCDRMFKPGQNPFNNRGHGHGPVFLDPTNIPVSTIIVDPPKP